MHDTSSNILSCFARFNYATKKLQNERTWNERSWRNVWCWYLRPACLHHEVSTACMSETQSWVLNDGYSMTGTQISISNPKAGSVEQRNPSRTILFGRVPVPLPWGRVAAEAPLSDATSSVLLMATEIGPCANHGIVYVPNTIPMWHPPSCLESLLSKSGCELFFSNSFLWKGPLFRLKEVGSFFSLALLPRSPFLWVDTRFYFPFLCLFFFSSSPLVWCRHRMTSNFRDLRNKGRIRCRPPILFFLFPPSSLLSLSLKLPLR